MKNNQVTIDPNNVDASLRQLNRFYRVDDETLQMLRRVIEQYPKPIIMYVDEANAPLFAHSLLDDLFTFNMQTGELILFSADPHTFIDAIIEMWMFVEGFQTLMGDKDYWKVEFAIGAWKPVKNNIKEQLGIPVQRRFLGFVGLPPELEDAPMEDPYPFKTLVESFNLIAFTEMVRFAGRDDIRVHFPDGTASEVKEAYYAVRRAVREVGSDLGIADVDAFNQRLIDKIEEISERFEPHKLPIPEEWKALNQDMDAASGAEGKTDEDESESNIALLLGPPKDEPEIGQLLSSDNPDDETPRDENADEPDMDTDSPFDDLDEEQRRLDRKLANSPFADFIETLFDDE